MIIRRIEVRHADTTRQNAPMLLMITGRSTGRGTGRSTGPAPAGGAGDGWRAGCAGPGWQAQPTADSAGTSANR